MQRTKTETRQHWLLDNTDIWEEDIYMYIFIYFLPLVAGIERMTSATCAR